MEFLASLWAATQQAFSESHTLSQSLASLLVLLAAMLATRASTRYYREKGSGSTGERRIGYVAVRNASVVVAIVLLLFIWGGQLRHFALSVAALAAAAAIASKEFVMSGLGSLMRALQQPYAVGDVIEIGGQRGEVLSIDLLTTTLLEQSEAGYVTGRTSQFPNMLVLLNPVRKMSATGSFVLETVRVPMEPHDDIVSARERLLAAGVAVCAPWMAQAEAHFRHIEGAYLIALPPSQPLALIEPVDAKRVDVALRFPCPSNRRVAVSQDILAHYYERGAEPPLPA